MGKSRVHFWRAPPAEQLGGRPPNVMDFQREPGVNYDFAEVPVEATVGSAGRATPEELVELAAEIWQAVRASGVPPEDEGGSADLLDAFQVRYKDFATSFPMVLRWMVQMRKFGREPFRKYLLKHATAKLSSHEEFLDLQADYLVLVYRADHPHPDERLVAAYRVAVREALQKEHKKFVEVSAQVDKDFEARAREVAAARRADLCAALKVVSALQPAPAAAPRGPEKS